MCYQKKIHNNNIKQQQQQQQQHTCLPVACDDVDYRH